MTRTFLVRIGKKGGPGSGFRGHGGRPGQRGGSAPKALFLTGMSDAALIDAARRMGRHYFGESLIFSESAIDKYGNIGSVSKSEVDAIEKERWESEPEEFHGKDVPLVDEDFTYVLEYDPKTGGVTKPEGYDPHAFSSAAMFDRSYVNDWHVKNAGSDKKLITYSSSQDSLEIWPKLGKRRVP